MYPTLQVARGAKEGMDPTLQARGAKEAMALTLQVARGAKEATAATIISSILRENGKYHRAEATIYDHGTHLNSY